MPVAVHADWPGEKAWFGVGLGQYREDQGTYGYYPYNELPPIADRYLNGNFEYLNAGPPKESPLKQEIEDLQQQLSQHHLSFPASFLTFMLDQSKLNSIASVTACYYSLSKTLVASPFVNNGWIVRFYRDQQDCLYWYLHFNGAGDCVVIASSILYDNEDAQDDITAKDGTVLVAQSFEEFIFRLWLETKLWYSLEMPGRNHGGLSELEMEYIDHYKRLGEQEHV